MALGDTLTSIVLQILIGLGVLNSSNSMQFVIS